MANGAMFRGARWGQCMSVRSAHHTSIVVPQPDRFGFPTSSSRRASDGGTVPDGSGFNAAAAKVVLRKHAWPSIFNWRAMPNSRGATPVSCVPEPNLLFVATTASACRSDLVQPPHYDFDHVDRGAGQNS